MTDFDIAAHTHDLLGEVPVWCDASSRLWWVDVTRSTIRCLDPSDGTVTSTIARGHRLGSIALRDGGGLLLATAEGIDFLDPATGIQQQSLASDRLVGGQRYNDGRCDRQGRFWVGTMDEDLRPNGVLYRVDVDGRRTAFQHEIIVPNGLAFSPDGTTMYFADTRRYTIWSFDFDPHTGTPSNRKVFAQTTGRPGRPDGSCVDAEGFVWNAEYAGGQLTRYAPDGRIDRTISLPVSHPTSLCFGGPALDTLFVTSASHTLDPRQLAREPLAGAVLALHPGVPGLPESRYKG